MRGRRESDLIACENAKLGCRIQLRPKDMPAHLKNCLFRTVTCELCDKKLLLRDLVFHQKIKQCHETKIKRERIEHSKKIHNQVMTHARQIRGLSAGRQVSHRKHFREKVHNKLGWTPPVPSAWSPDSPALSHRIRNQLSPRKPIDLGLDLGKLAELTQIEGDRLEEMLPMLTDRGQFYSADGNEDELILIPDVDIKTPMSARAPKEGPEVCMRCSKIFRPSGNHLTACRWHRGVSTLCVVFSFSRAIRACSIELFTPIFKTFF